MRIKSVAFNAARAIAPEYMDRMYHRRRRAREARQFAETLRNAGGMEQRFNLTRDHAEFRSNQKPSEIVALLRELDQLRPKVLCEIGAYTGGTLALFATTTAPRARLLSLDINYPDERAHVYGSLAGSNNSIACLEADSHAPETLSRVKAWLGTDRFDFLFIDGDHSYAGVKSDYEMYGPLVRPGGIIAFHDIVPDFMTRFGIKSGNDAGEVPRFWRELSPTMRESREFVENPEQDAYGIGMIRVG